jgi:hypothetical protein
MRPPVANFDLPWYFGSGPENYEGDCGLRSNLGGQLALLAIREAGSTLPRAPTVDASSFEDAMIDRLGAAHRARQIEERLTQLSPLHNRVLAIHYGGGSLPGVDLVAVLAPSARRLVLGELRSQAWSAVQDIKVARAASKGDKCLSSMKAFLRWQFSQAEAATTAEHLAQQALRRARDEQRALRHRELPPEVLRQALYGATDDERRVVEAEAETMITEAVGAYERTRIAFSRPVQVHSPLRGRNG